MDEKRKNIRVEKSLVVQYAQNTSGQNPCWDSTTIKNISADGMLFNSSKLFTKNSILNLRFAVPTDPANRLTVEGEVIESFLEGHITRIKFINLGENEKKVINNYIAYLLSRNKQK